MVIVKPILAVLQCIALMLIDLVQQVHLQEVIQVDLLLVVEDIRLVHHLLVREVILAVRLLREVIQVVQMVLLQEVIREVLALMAQLQEAITVV